MGVWRLFPEVVDVPLCLLASFSAALCNEPFPVRRSAPFPYTVAALPPTAVTSSASCAPERIAHCHTISGGHKNSRITTPIGKHHRNVPRFLPPPIPNSFWLKEEYNHCLQGQNRWAIKPHDKDKGSGNPHSKNKTHTFKGMHFFHKHSTFSKNYFKQRKNKLFRHLCIQAGPTWTQMNLRLNCISMQAKNLYKEFHQKHLYRCRLKTRTRSCIKKKDLHWWQAKNLYKELHEKQRFTLMQAKNLYKELHEKQRFTLMQAKNLYKELHEKQRFSLMQAKNSYKELHEKQSLGTRYASLCLRPMMWSIMLLRLERMSHSSHRYSSSLPTTVSTTNPRPVTTQSSLLYIHLAGHSASDPQTETEWGKNRHTRVQTNTFTHWNTINFFLEIL